MCLPLLLRVAQVVLLRNDKHTFQLLYRYCTRLRVLQELPLHSRDCQHCEVFHCSQGSHASFQFYTVMFSRHDQAGYRTTIGLLQRLSDSSDQQWINAIHAATCCTDSSCSVPNFAMTQVLHLTIALLPTKQRCGLLVYGL